MSLRYTMMKMIRWMSQHRLRRNGSLMQGVGQKRIIVQPPNRKLFIKQLLRLPIRHQMN